MSLEINQNEGKNYYDGYTINYKRLFSTGRYNYLYTTDLGEAYVNFSYIDDDNFTITIDKKLDEGKKVSEEVIKLLVKHFLKQAIKQDREFLIVNDNKIKIYK